MITELWAYIAEGESGEELMGVRRPDSTVKPLFVGADRDQMETMLPLVRKLAKKEGLKIKLVRFSVREVVTPDIEIDVY